MFKNICCSICLCVNEKSINIHDTDLQYVYEKLANFKVKPELGFLCYICHTRLRQFFSLQNTASSSQPQPLVHLTTRNIETETISSNVVLGKEELWEFDVQERYFDSDSTIKLEIENMESLDSKGNDGSHVEEKCCEGLETPTHPKRMRVRQPARVVKKTSGGSLLTGASVACKTTPAGHVPVLKPSKPLCANAVERVEAMDLSQEGEVMEASQELPLDGEAEPWRGGEAEGCSSTDVPKPSTSAEVAPDNASGIISICAANISNSEGSPNATSDDVLPSTSGMKKTRKRSARSGAREGSELDSDFDDEFDESAVDVTNLATLDRNIPNDDELEEPVREIIGAMESIMDAEADRLPGVSTSYDWKEDFDSFTGVPESFSGPTPGPVKDYYTSYHAFTDIWSKDIIDRIVLATNRYANQTIDKMKAEGTLKPTSRLHMWTDTDADEIMVLFAVFMYMAIDPRTNQYEYWKSDDYLEMPKFRKLMTYNRYILLSNFLYFADNSDVSQNSPRNEEIWLSPKLAKLQPVISHLKYKFASLYNLDRFVSIDESLTLFKGRLAWVQTIRTKAARFKSYELCESRTGYMYDFEIYTGKNSDRDDTADADVAPSVDLAGKSTKIVLHLLKDLKNQGHCVTMDNFYNCPALARYLKSLGFDCLGTLRPNRRNVPTDVAKMPNNVAKGTIVARHCGDVSVLGWKDSKVVTMISTYHTDDTFVGSKKGKMQVKPKCVGDYNKTMGGVDLKDQKLSMYLLERKRGAKWYTKMFKRLLNTSIHNALIMLVTSLARRNKLPMTQREFRYDLAKSLVDRHHRARGLTVTTPKASEVTRLRRDIVHEPMYTTGRNNRKRCNVCYRQGIDKMVHSQCVTCAQYLCFEKCWKEWHSLTNLKSKASGRKRSRIGN